MFFYNEPQPILQASGSLWSTYCKAFVKKIVDKTKSGRRIHRKVHGIIGFADLAKHVGEKWIALDRVSHAYSKKMAKLDKK